jgi:orotate phosphoribosyltransferase
MNPIDDQMAALKRLLLEKSVMRGTFRLASGAESDFYVDCRLTLLDPLGAKLAGAAGYDVLRRVSAQRATEIDAIGGLTMGADPLALAISLASLDDRPHRRLQAFSVRKSPKEHGRSRLIEGNFKPGNTVVVVDDVITTGGSTLKAIHAVRESGGHVEFAIVVVDREEGGRQAIEREGVPVHSLFRKSDLIKEARLESSPAAG